MQSTSNIAQAIETVNGATLRRGQFMESEKGGGKRQVRLLRSWDEDSAGLQRGVLGGASMTLWGRRSSLSNVTSLSLQASGKKSPCTEAYGAGGANRMPTIRADVFVTASMPGASLGFLRRAVLSQGLVRKV